ncbi:hypothetical protein GCM10008908_33280 [Clostridium subterminale]|uniref:Uncharacterized protein n=1 Tax=Clostridium subterminale TaxID=1550 RepID=A0ABP3W9Y6_CLOSU
MDNFVKAIPTKVVHLLTTGIIIFVLAGMFISVNSIINLNTKLEEIHYVKEQIWNKLCEEGMR